MTNAELARKYEDYIISLRRHFHENPEVSGKEEETVRKISEELTAMGVEHTVIPNGGVLAKLQGPKDNGRAVLIRADCDALPVKESPDNLLPGKRTCLSKNPGVMHACGHDGHTAMLLGTAKILKERESELAGTVYLCFERGEENTRNVIHIFKYIEEQGIHIDACYGTHVAAGLPSGSMYINDTDMNAGPMIFDITIVGRGGHGSRPDEASSPIDCFVAIYQRLQSLRLLKVSPFKTCAYSVGIVQAGTQDNIIPGSLRFAGSMRTFDPDGAGMQFHDAFKEAVDGICAAYDCKPVYNIYSRPALPVVNTPEFARFAREVISEAVPGLNVIQHEPEMGSESFGMYLAQWPGCFAQLGIGNPEKGTGAAHHNEAFDIDEAVLWTGSAASAEYAMRYLTSDLPANGRKSGFKELLLHTGDKRTLSALYGE